MAIANPEVEFHMNGFLDQCVELLNNHYDSKFPTTEVFGSSSAKRMA